jgi:hypothetical protein
VRFDERSCDSNIIQITKPFTDAIIYPSSTTHSQNIKVSSLEIQPLSDFLLLDSEPTNPLPQASTPQVPSSMSPQLVLRPAPLPPFVATPPQVPPRSQRPRRQNVRLNGYDFFVSTDDFDICMLSQDNNPDLDNSHSNSPDPDLHSNDVTFE